MTDPSAGCVCWRPGRESGPDGVQVLLTPRDGGWSWPVSAPEAGETLPECAARLARQSAGPEVTLSRPLTPDPPAPAGGDRRLPPHWTARAPGGKRAAPAVDGARWAGLREAARLLDRADDRALLSALDERVERGDLETRPVLVIRHARAHPRDSWSQADADRPLVPAGRRQSLALVTLLGCWHPEYLLSSPWRRCLQTIEPYAAATGVRLRAKGGLSEDGHQRDPHKALRHVGRLLGRDEAAAICTHRKVLNTVLARMAAIADEEVRGHVPTGEPFLSPGEVLVAHLLRSGGRGNGNGGRNGPRIVAVERHLPRPD